MERTMRLATQADLPAVERIIEAAYSPYIARIGRKPGPMLDDHAASIRDRHVHLIELVGEIQGILVLIPEGDALLLDNIAIAPAAQGQGLGRSLLQAAESMARNASYRRIRLYTNEAMTENIALYTRRGYIETHRAEEKGLRRVYMEKDLS
ncbi:GNAT family N-acetyltransferase [Labrys okinawensis]|uniref:GNAT family N-acetyltransferase n=2 Tax=Labrys okinawensis TaxID=346911 RepID=A0A2S9Q5D4_9HYPH|nr:GNAT family N-acetyltransferase [Labrys okinawensis]